MSIDILSIDPQLLYINFLICPAGFKTVFRDFPFSYFLYVHAGRGTITVGDAAYDAKEGDLFFCEPHVKNKIEANAKTTFTLTGIDFYFDRNYTVASIPKDFLPYLKTRDSIRWFIMELLNQFKASKGDSPYSRSLLKSFLCLVAELSCAESDTDITHAIQQFLSAHIKENVTAAQIAAALGYHPNYLNRVFKASLGTTMRQYHLDLKIRKAMEMISHTDLNLQSIANECGFEDQNYFSRLFRKRTGVSPTIFRQRHDSENDIAIEQKDDI